MSAKIIIIDDDSSTLESIGSYLKELGFVVTTATNGVDGLELIKIYRPDLVISDVKMPKLGGVELNFILKGMNFRKPIIFISAFEKENVSKAEDYFAFIPKPIDIFELTREVNRALAS